MTAFRNIILALFLLGSYQAVATVHRYVILFTDKNNSAYSVDRPQEFLSQRSIDRRLRNSASVTIDDLPVNEEYVTGLKNEGVLVFYTSRWFNAAIAEMEESLVPNIELLPFVQSIEKVGDNSKLNGRTKNTKFHNQAERITGGESDFQINYIGADEMHADGYKGQGVLIAVTDGGFKMVNTISQFAHLFDQSKVKYTYDFTTNDSNAYDFTDHGTQVLSTMAAMGEGFMGVAPDAEYMLFVTEDVSSEYHIEEYNWLIAAEFADSAGVDIINASIGYNLFDEGVDYTYQDLDGNTTVITRAANFAASKGILVVTGAGNEGSTSWRYILAPGDSESVLTVGSVTSSGSTSSFSGEGPTSDGRIKPDVATLGSAVSVINENGIIIRSSGTSFSAPQIAGFAAGIMEAYPDLTVQELISLLRQSGSLQNNPDNEQGYGIPNYSLLVSLQTTIPLPNYFRVFPNPVKEGTIQLTSVNLLTDQNLEIEFLNTNGKVFRKLTRKLGVINNSLTLDLNFLPQGSYIMQIRTPGKAESFRIIKVQ